LVDTYALVDSGADISILSAELASMLDIDLTQLKQHTLAVAFSIAKLLMN